MFCVLCYVSCDIAYMPSFRIFYLPRLCLSVHYVLVSVRCILYLHCRFAIHIACCRFNPLLVSDRAWEKDSRGFAFRAAKRLLAWFDCDCADSASQGAPSGGKPRDKAQLLTFTRISLQHLKA